MKTVSLITTERQHLFEITHKLMGAIDPAFLWNRLRPVVVSVQGGFSAGKKIIPDAAREVLFDALKGLRTMTNTGRGKRTAFRSRLILSMPRGIPQIIASSISGPIMSLAISCGNFQDCAMPGASASFITYPRKASGLILKFFWRMATAIRSDTNLKS